MNDRTNKICYSALLWKYPQVHVCLYMNHHTKHGVSVNSICYSPWHKRLCQIWSISKLNLLFIVTRTTVLSTCMEVSVSLSCLFVHEPLYQTIVVCCNPVFCCSSSCMNHYTKFLLDWGTLSFATINGLYINQLKRCFILSTSWTFHTLSRLIPISKAVSVYTI